MSAPAKATNLYVVAQYYALARIDLQPTLAKPMLTINQQHSQADYCQKQLGFSRLI